MFAQNNNVGIGTNTPDPSAILELSDTTKGLLIPRTDTTNILSPATGLLIYQLGNVADLVAALPGDQITLGWAYNGGDDCCTFLCGGNDGNYHHVYGYQSAANKPYVRVTYQAGPPAGFDKVWTGSTSTSWATSSNWCPTGKPNSGHRVYIPNTTNKPTLSTSESVSCITIYSDGGAVVTITGTGTLNVGNASCPTFP